MDLTQVKQTYEVFSKLQFVTLKKYIKGINNESMIFTNKMEGKIKLRWIHMMCMFTQFNSSHTLRNLFEHLI